MKIYVWVLLKEEIFNNGLALLYFDADLSVFGFIPLGVCLFGAVALPPGRE